MEKNKKKFVYDMKKIITRPEMLRKKKLAKAKRMDIVCADRRGWPRRTQHEQNEIALSDTQRFHPLTMIAFVLEMQKKK